MPFTVTETLSSRIRRALAAATVGRSHLHGEAWRRERDRLVDIFDPRGDSEIDVEGMRDIIDFLSESTASRNSRMTGRQWDVEVDDIVVELLAASR